MPNNMTQSNKRQNMSDKSGQGHSQEDKYRHAGDRNQNMGYGKDPGSGRQGSGSKSGEGMSKPDSRTSQR